MAQFEPDTAYDFWHDRAAFHFLTDEADVQKYVGLVQKAVAPGGVMAIGTFSEQGPKKCSGIDIKQYSAVTLPATFEGDFQKIECFNVAHTTPSESVQQFVFCSFKRK